MKFQNRKLEIYLILVFPVRRLWKRLVLDIHLRINICQKDSNIRLSLELFKLKQPTQINNIYKHKFVKRRLQLKKMTSPTHKKSTPQMPRSISPTRRTITLEEANTAILGRKKERLASPARERLSHIKAEVIAQFPQFTQQQQLKIISERYKDFVRQEEETKDDLELHHLKDKTVKDLSEQNESLRREIEALKKQQTISRVPIHEPQPEIDMDMALDKWFDENDVQLRRQMRKNLVLLNYGSDQD